MCYLAMEKLDATRADAMVGDDNINFDYKYIKGTSSGAYLSFVGRRIGRGRQEKEWLCIRGPLASEV